jgi:hypothetical protein
MDGDDATPVPPDGLPPPGGPSRVPPSTWVGVAVIGAILFGVGIWIPAWRGIPGAAGGLNLLAAAGGAVLLIVGITLAVRGTNARRPTSVEQLPGVEFFRPPTASRVRVAEPAPDEDEA